MKSIVFFLAVICIASCSKKQEEQSAAYSSSYKAVAVTNGGTIKGSVKTDANQKYPARIETQKDEDVCGTSHTNLASPNQDGTVPHCIIGIEHITSGKDFSKHEYTFDQHGCDFHPHIQIVNLGSTIIFSNSDKALHNYHVNRNGETVINEAQPEGDQQRR